MNILQQELSLHFGVKDTFFSGLGLSAMDSLNIRSAQSSSYEAQPPQLNSFAEGHVPLELLSNDQSGPVNAWSIVKSSGAPPKTR
jgi:hypothetical protein